ncbi:glycosyltransferase family 4 protein [Virgibacillus sp. MSP4-1]|uniref:glycosyltransferase family 4 protein n=1 Tax=Virgibacillus sp. MSP4-1 TaxID=2700081 RepID=UPI0003A877D9|nr:glycosyltransferase family 4 protein [Virgibacillus sp. MSP4-1]QHS23481.1 glycosyltransferase family 4 protein [Virgibacillus sp. MSP4-1]
MNVLFLMLNYPHDQSREHMYKDLSRKFAEEGHNVYVAALLENKHGKQTYVQNEGNHHILWIKAGNYFGVNKIVKGITALRLPHYFNKNIKKHFRDVQFDLIVYPTPAITLYYTVNKIKKNNPGAKTLLIVKDIFPQNALDIGLMKKGLIYKVFRYIERRIYRISDYLGCMSSKNVEYIAKHNNVPPQKFFILENWSSTLERLQLQEPELNNIKNKYGLKEKFVCTFGGNISPANELEFLIKLAEKVEKNQIKDIVFVIIGKGIAKKKIENEIRRKNLSNVKIFDLIPTEEYDQLLQATDIGLINLNRQYTIPNIPSKTLNLMRIGKPILAATDSNTDYKELITDYANCGLWCETGDLDTYYNNLLKLKNSNKLRDMFSENARKYFLDNLTTGKAYESIMKKIGE